MTSRSEGDHYILDGNEGITNRTIEHDVVKFDGENWELLGLVPSGITRVGGRIHNPIDGMVYYDMGERCDYIFLDGKCARDGGSDSEGISYNFTREELIELKTERPEIYDFLSKRGLVE